jgi:protein SCO1
VRYLSLLILAVALGLSGCKTNPNPESVKQFELRGEVLKLDASQRIATIRHGKIDGWMEAMTMDFPVREGEALGNLQPGAHIQATVYVQSLTFSIGNVHIYEPDK